MTYLFTKKARVKQRWKRNPCEKKVSGIRKKDVCCIQLANSILSLFLAAALERVEGSFRVQFLMSPLATAKTPWRQRLDDLFFY